MKLAVLSHFLPPSPYGQAVILQRILRALDPYSYCLLSDENFQDYSPTQGSGLYSNPRLPAKYYRLPFASFGVRSVLKNLLWRVPLFESSRSNETTVFSAKTNGEPSRRTSSEPSALEIARRTISELLVVFRRSAATVRIIKQEGCGAVLVCSGDPFDLPAAYLASRLARIPLLVYLFDDYLYQWRYSPYHRLTARLSEPLAIKGAAVVVTPNEFLRDEYRERYDVEPLVIHNPNEGLETKDQVVHWPAGKDEITIVYTGTVYHAHYDAFRNLVSAIEQLGNSTVKLHVYTAQSRDMLEGEGIYGPVVVHSHVDALTILEVQRQADILFLPLAFESSIPEVIRTSSPGKIGEYLASGRPILVHAPADSFVSWYFREHECGLVVDQNDRVSLAGAIRRILKDEGLRRTMQENARIRSRVDFSLAVAQAKFIEVLQVGQGE